MNRKTILKICIDAAMFVLFLLLMSEFLLKDAHLWIGIAAAALFVFHNILNIKWYNESCGFLLLLDRKEGRVDGIQEKSRRAGAKAYR